MGCCTAPVGLGSLRGGGVGQALTYLSTTEGGETTFPSLGLAIQPKCGRVLVFKNLVRVFKRPFVWLTFHCLLFDLSLPFL